MKDGVRQLKFEEEAAIRTDEDRMGNDRASVEVLGECDDVQGSGNIEEEQGVQTEIGKVHKKRTESDLRLQRIARILQLGV